VGATFALDENITTKSLITYTKNYGDNRTNGVFSPFKIQWYTMQEIKWQMPNTQLSLSGTIGYDFGDLSNNVGTMLGLQWQLRR
jgi:hypothetical protein